MLGKARRLQPVAQVLEPGEVIRIKRSFAANGQSHAMHGNSKTLGERAELC